MATQVSALKKIAEGREAEMFAWEDGRVLRLYRAGYGAHASEDARILDFARSAGIRVPEAFGVVEVDERRGVILERLTGPDLVTEVGKQPWRLWEVGGIWGRLQAELATKLAPAEIEPTASRHQRLIENSPLIPEDLRGPALSALAELPPGDRMNHGDLHPANIMRNGKEIVLIDWSNVTRGPPEADYARSYLMCTLGDLPPGTPWFIRTFARFGRRLLRGSFVGAYQRALPLDPAAVEAWRMPVMVSRLAEGIEPERAALIAQARQSLNDRGSAQTVT